MVRFPRLHAPGGVFHVIARFVNREYRLQSEDDRAHYLAGVPQALERSDWRPLGFALMSSHVHWVLAAGEAPLSSFIKPLHTRFALFSNRSNGRLGPVFSGRPSSVLVEADLGRLLAYVHNNPVRAGVVADAAASTWTSHRFYIGQAEVPSWLDVDLGMRLAGFGGSDAAAFQTMVEAHANEGRCAVLVGDGLNRIREQIRERARAPVEISSPLVDPLSERLTTLLCTRVPIVSSVRPESDFRDLVGKVSDVTGVPVTQVQRGSSRRPSVFARRVFLEAAIALGHTLKDAGAAVGLSLSGASTLLHRSKDREAVMNCVATILEGEQLGRGKCEL